MESLSDTPWDVVISGTGLQQSLLALALSRSDKKVLHVDENEYYGGPDAAFSLQEADEWVTKISQGTCSPQFTNASVWRNDEAFTNNDRTNKLGFSRAYTLTLSPQIIYTRSDLLSQLVSSKVYKQLEFQAVGTWWIYHQSDDGDGSNLRRLPNGREDIFSDRSIDVRAKRSLMKFLKFVVDYEAQTDVWETRADSALPVFLSTQFQLSPVLQTLITALTLSLDLPKDTKVSFALPRIARHLTSIGVFGSGFGSVIAKWGGGSEIAQVACRAGAVGGGVYVLGTGIGTCKSDEHGSVAVSLTNNESVTSKMVVQPSMELQSQSQGSTSVSKVVAVVGSDLSHLFTSSVEGAPLAAVAVVAFPSKSLNIDDVVVEEPIYAMVHSSETGECPAGQCVLYASTSTGTHALERMNLAIDALCSTPGSSMAAKVLYRLSYEQNVSPSAASNLAGVYTLPSSSLDLAFDDEMLSDVEAAWQQVMQGVDRSSEALLPPYMTFQDRQGMNDENKG